MGGEAGGSAEPPAPLRGQRLSRRPPASLGLTCRRSPLRPALPSRSPALATCPAAAGPGRGSPPAWRVTAGRSPPRLARPVPGMRGDFPEPGAHSASFPTTPPPPGTAPARLPPGASPGDPGPVPVPVPFPVPAGGCALPHSPRQCLPCEGRHSSCQRTSNELGVMQSPVNVRREYSQRHL